MTTAAVERTAAGVYFFGVKQDAPDDALNLGCPENLLRWAREEGRASHPALGSALDALPRFVKHGDAERAGRVELRNWPVSLMSGPDLSDDDRRVLDMFQRRERPLTEKVRDVLRHHPLALPRKAARYVRWRWLQRRGKDL